MHEIPSNSPEHQREIEGKEIEVAKLVELIWYISERITNEPPGQTGADFGFDILDEYFMALAQRDPEMGHMLIATLESQPSYFTRLHPDKTKQRALDQLRKMGYAVTLDPLEAAG